LPNTQQFPELVLRQVEAANFPDSPPNRFEVNPRLRFFRDSTIPFQNNLFLMQLFIVARLLYPMCAGRAQLAGEVHLPCRKGDHTW
jgi:hypothetical protein